MHSINTAAFLALLHLQAVPLIAAQASSSAPPSTFVVPAQFPSSVFSSYYYAASPSVEPQPAIHDPVYNFQFPLNLTDPDTIPTNDTDPAVLPPPTAKITDAQAQAMLQSAMTQIEGIVAGSGTNCTKCVGSLGVLQNLSMQAPQLVSTAMVDLCQRYKLHSNSTCEEDFGLYTDGSIWTQVIRYGDIKGLDGRYMCYYISKTTCPRPVVDPPLDTSKLFPKPKPANAVAPKASGKRVKVLHMSDIHLDPRYAPGSEVNCSANLCCRTNQFATGHNASSPVEVPSPLFGAYQCDSPYFLVTAALQAAHPLTGTTPDPNASQDCKDKDSTFGWTIYTGDLVSHDTQSQLSQAYTEYAETSIYRMLQYFITGPVFAVLGNHDTNPEAQTAPHALPDGLGKQMSWNYNHVAGLWENDHFLPADAANQARIHYGGYSVKNQYGLRIITLNTDFWLTGNIFNYLNASNPDFSGMLKWLIDELQSAEDCGERVWILGHVLSGWDGTNPLPNPTDMFYQIVDRYSPHVIANVFWGHTHEDEQFIYYSKNGTTRNTTEGRSDALTTAWVGPSVTPLTNLNSGFRMYEVDTGSFDVYEAYTYNANVSAFPALANTGPTFGFEYSTRKAYGQAANWPASAPLNATFWHAVSQAWESQALAGNTSLIQTQNAYQGKQSIMTPNCTSVACALARVCYTRSGSTALGLSCPQGYGSVQSAFTPSS